jgi:type I restriction-modification system DNA methylase subunit
MAESKGLEEVLLILKHFRGMESLKKLFWEKLSYEGINRPLSRRGWSQAANNALKEDPLLFASGGENNDFHIIYNRVDSDCLLLGHERPVVNQLLREHPYALFVFSNKNQNLWHFINIKYDEKVEKRRLMRRITVGPEERLRTASERINKLDLATLANLSLLSVQARHDEAFNVEAVTEEFFESYKDIFNKFQEDLQRQTGDKKWAHDYALQFLSRLMFLYFIQRKGWLGDDREFVCTLWESYGESGRPEDTFVEQWLKVLFFEAFNSNDKRNLLNAPQRAYMPDGIRKALLYAPYLNGGLFTENELDTKYDFAVPDDLFEEGFKFLEHYNFTIAEDSPLSQEVAVDPEMIGNVYESLVNVSEEADERGGAGIYYTHRIEIDLMCRLALVDHLVNHFGADKKGLIYELVFSLEQEEKEEADRKVSEAGLWQALSDRLKEVAILDPACGSGSFLVGMLHILDDLHDRANRRLEIRENPYDRKKRIIGNSLYGVDVMEWACRVAELRLWLALVIDAEFSREELFLRKEPLLPHFSFKIRCGDSLVQEIGGINFGHTRHSLELSKSLKDRITKHKNEKLRFYNNDPSCRYRTANEARENEEKLFRDLIETHREDLKKRIHLLRQRIECPESIQLVLYGKEIKPSQLNFQQVASQKELESFETELERIENARKALTAVKEVPFVWDIAFVEIFEGDKKGFDIVIGNPPYVRQENIADPRLPREEVAPENKKVYKEKLFRSVYAGFPSFFESKPPYTTAKHKLNAKSDLYIYFYFQGLSLLNQRGAFCFITSNSWLDVGYGKDLQEFLLKHCRVKIILDNQVKRSFSSADVNTVIALLSAPDVRNNNALENTARFVMLRVSFEQVLSPVIFEEIEGADERKATPEYRLFSVKQKKLLEAGSAVPEEEEERSSAVSVYTGDKWGGKYLRAPDIYWTILEKGKGKLVRLGDIAEVRFGIKTGANDFFFVKVLEVFKGVTKIKCDDGSEHLIEEKWVQHPVVTKARELIKPCIELESLSYRIVLLDETALKYPHAANYIKWGESKGFHKRQSTKGRKFWFHIEYREPSHILIPLRHKRKPVAALSRCIKASDCLTEVRLFEPSLHKIIAGCAISAFSMLFWEIIGRANFGQGLLETRVYEIADLPVLDPQHLSSYQRKKIEEAFNSVGKRPSLMFYDEARQIDRQALDETFLELIGFEDPTERKSILAELYESVSFTIWERMAKSTTARESRIAYKDWISTGAPFALNGVFEEEEAL